jgi:hypothetical protein
MSESYRSSVSPLSATVARADLRSFPLGSPASRATVRHDTRSVRPEDFPIGSLASRAAARAMLQARSGMQSAPLIFRVPWVGRPGACEQCQLYDYETGLPIPATCDLGATTDDGGM